MKANSKSTKIIAAIGLLGVCIFLVFGSEIKKYIDEKVFESTYQFFLVTIIGGGVSLIFESYRRDHEAKEREAEHQREEQKHQEEIQREAKERRREIQRSLRANLIVAFNNIKKVRRLLRAEAILGEPHEENEVVVGEEYKKQMNALMDAQLSIEFAYRVIKYESDLFQDSTLAAKLKGANKYLRDIIDEYEKSYRKFSTESTIHLHEFPKLYDFIRPSAEAKEIKKDFWDPFYNAFDIIGRVLQS
jgi:hypothetical protein